MKVEEIMVKDIKYVSPGSTVSKALGIMKNNRIHQLLAIDGKKLLGMVELKELVTKDLDPETAKIQHHIKKTPIVGPKEDVEKSIGLLLNSGSGALPVVDKDNVVGVISETDIIQHAQRGTENPARGLATKCLYVEKNDSVGKIKNIMLEKNISRIPVMDRGKIIGIVDTLDMIKVFGAREKMKKRGKESGSKDKLHLEGVSVETIMSKANPLGRDARVGDVINLLKNQEGVVIEGEDVCIITPKDVLEMFVSVPKKGVYVQVTGLHKEGKEFVALLDKETDSFVQKMGKIVDNLEYLFIHIERMTKGGKKIKYSIRTRFKTPFGLFVSHAWGWNPINVAQEAMDKLEREVMKKYEKLRERGRPRGA